MATISERLRDMAAGRRNAVGDAWGTHTNAEAADTIDALVAALEAIQRETMRCRGEQSYRDAAKFALRESSAALALAQGGK